MSKVMVVMGYLAAVACAVVPLVVELLSKLP